MIMVILMPIFGIIAKSSDLNNIKMKSSLETVPVLISKRINEKSSGDIFFINEFSEFNDEYVGRILSQAVAMGKIVRIANGIYYKPVMSKFGIVYPSTEKLIRIIMERDNASILPSGATALNRLGLSTQVPMNPVFLTNGSARIISLGNKKITLKRAVQKNFMFEGKLMPVLVQALKSMGESNITSKEEGDIQTVISRYPDELDDIRKGLPYVPNWMRKLLNNIIKKI